MIAALRAAGRFQPYLLALLICPLLLSPALPPPKALAQNDAALKQEELTAAEWREDLHFLAENLPKTHKNLFHTMTGEEFERAVALLDRDIPSLDSYSIYIRLIQLCALVQDGHTRLVQGSSRVIPGGLFLPVRFARFADGIYVLGAASDFAAAAGGKVVAIGKVGWEEALRRMATLIAHDPGNDGNQLWNATVYLSHAGFLRGLGLANPDGSVDLVLDQAGRRTVFKMTGAVPAPEWLTSGVPAGWVDARPVSAPVPLSIPHVDEPQWLSYLPEHRAVYFQFNSVENGRNESLAQLARRLGTMLERDDADRVVIDLRNNSGGDNTLLRPLLVTLTRCRQNCRGSMVALIGPRTFSAAQCFADRLEDFTETIFLGEPTGQNVNFYGNPSSLELPHSRLVVQASGLWWQDKDPRDNRPYTAPLIAVRGSFADYVAGRDPALELALSMPAPPSLEERLEEGLPGGVDTLLTRYDAWVTDPAHVYLPDPENQVNSYGYELLRAKRLRDATVVFELNVQRHSKSGNVFDSLGEAYAAAGDTAKAVGLYRRSVELDPNNANGKAALQRLTRR